MIELKGSNVATTHISCPADPSKTLGIKLPFLVLLVKNLDHFFTLEAQVLDDKGVKRRFRASTFQASYESPIEGPHCVLSALLTLRLTPTAFRTATTQSTTRVNSSICTMPLRLEPGWNQIQFDLGDFLRRAYGSGYIETLRVQIHANCRLRRVYFADRAYSEEELPQEFKLFVPQRAPKLASEAAERGEREPAEGVEGEEGVEADMRSPVPGTSSGAAA